MLISPHFTCNYAPASSFLSLPSLFFTLPACLLLLMKHFPSCSIFVIFKHQPHLLDPTLQLTKECLIISILIGVVPPRWNRVHSCFLLHRYRVNWNSMALYRCAMDVCSSRSVLWWRMSPFSFEHVTSPPSQRCHCPYLFYLANVGHPCMAAISEAQSNSCVWSLPLPWFMGRCDAQLSEGPPLSCYSSQLPT